MDKVRQLLKKFYANKILFIIVCVICLTSLTIGVSYSAFFSVKTNSVNQVVSTGSLNVTYSGNNSVIAYDYIEPLTDEEGMSQTSNRIVTVQNTSALDSKYTVTIGYDMTSFLARSDYNASDELTPIEYARLALYEYDTTNSTSTLISGPISIAELPIYSIDNSDSRYNKYSLLIDTVGSTTSGHATKTYQIKIWLSDDATAAATDTYFYFNTEVVARPQNDTLNYTINGILKNESGTAISGATISLHNGSIVTTSGTGGAFTLENVPVGTYNLDITASNVRYQGNITIKEGTQKSIKSLGTSFAPTNSSIFYSVDLYKSTVSKFLSYHVQLLDDTSNEIDMFDNISYYIPSSYELIGGYESNINTLVIIIGDMNYFHLKIIRGMYFEGETKSYYWNDNFSGEYFYSFPLGKKTVAINIPWENGNPVTYDSLEELQNNYNDFANNPIYIKTDDIEHQTCLYYNNHNFCFNTYYILSGETMSSLKTRLQSDITSALGTTVNCTNDNNEYVYCTVGSIYCSINYGSTSCNGSNKLCWVNNYQKAKCEEYN